MHVIVYTFGIHNENYKIARKKEIEAVFPGYKILYMDDAGTCTDRIEVLSLHPPHPPQPYFPLTGPLPPPVNPLNPYPSTSPSTPSPLTWPMFPGPLTWPQVTTWGPGINPNVAVVGGSSSDIQPV